MIRIVNSVREVFGKCSAFLRVQRSGKDSQLALLQLVLGIEESQKC